MITKRKFGTALLSVLASAATLVAPPAIADLDLPPAGDDQFDATEAAFTVQGPMGQMEVLCGGPVQISRQQPTATGIATRMESMNLQCSSGIQVVLDPNRPSVGRINPDGFSFFDVFVEIRNIPGVAGPARNEQPLNMRATIAHVPPYHSIYIAANVAPVRLLVGPTPVGQIVHAYHKTNGQTKPETIGEISRVFSCFYECKQDRFAANWLELTTLMLVNQSAQRFIVAEVYFVNGNQVPVARTRVTLSPFDVDEINVCETLNVPGIAGPPQAGLIEVVLTPVGGVYGWVKNLTGRMRKGLVEPFQSPVSGIGKTECRLVGPNVTTPSQVQGQLGGAPFVPPILIQGTADPLPDEAVGTRANGRK